MTDAHSAAPSEALFATAPAAALGDESALYSGLIGSWDVDVIDYDLADEPRRSAGEWHFAWVLEGRAVQDVFIVPRRDARGPGLPPHGNRYGTTLRYFDPKARRWSLTWINPVTGACNRLVARKEADAIVQIGTDEDGTMHRWTFVEIAPERFHWLGEESCDNGVTWTTTAEFRGRRRA